jgi:nitrogen fixation/metabolism regulation signal transduction histidine kinase
VKRIVEEHGGRVTAENRTDGSPGARFRLFFPLPAAA